jgi:hypothetical protein
MTRVERNLRRWARLGDVEFVRIEARPARRLKSDVEAVTLDWVPDGSSGACAAFQSLQRAVLRAKTHDEAARLYVALRSFAEAWSPEPVIPLCDRCGHKATSHAVDDEERRECTEQACACDAFEVAS